MPFNIKELFQSDLDPKNQSAWWSKEKVEKINYNFNQLLEGGERGPQGIAGFGGDMGSKGQQGNQGILGVQGAQGFEGVEANLNWGWIDGINNRTIYPYIEWDDIFGVSIIIGANESSNEYNQVSGYSAVSQLIIVTDQLNQLSLKLGEESYDHRFDGSTISKGKISNTNTTKLESIKEFNNTQYSYNSDALIINESEIEINTRFYADDLVSNGKFEYSQDADTFKVLTSIDANGTLAWKKKNEILFAFPIGSIVSIPYDYFNNSNFSLNNAYNLKAGALDIFYGRGRVGTAYEGWYICNGRTWNFNGSNSYDVPNLNSFTYELDSNIGFRQGTQPFEVGGDSTPCMIGGINSLQLSDWDGNDYTSTLSIDVSDINEDFTQGAGMSISRNIHIVYLGSSELTWSTVGTAVITIPIDLSVGSTSSIACAGQNQSFYWTGNGSTWDDTSASMFNVKLYDSNNNLAPSNKWYEADGLARYWNGLAFTQYQTCPITQNIDLTYSLDVRSLNGSSLIPSGTYSINTSLYTDATTLEFGGQSAPSGWYRESNGGVRRYWDGSTFTGHIISENYVYYAGEQDLSFQTGSSSCAYVDTNQKIYFATNSQISTPDQNILNDIYNSFGVVYVHRGWTGTQVGQSSLVKIYSQNGVFGSTTPYKTILDDVGTGFYRGSITTSSNILQPVICGNYILGGNTTSTPSYTVRSGTIDVIHDPAVITFEVFGGANTGCNSEATLVIKDSQNNTVALKNLFANKYVTAIDTVTINTLGSYTFTITAQYGCSSGNYAKIY